MIPFEVEEVAADDDDEAVDALVVEEVVVTGDDSKEASDEEELLDDLAMEVETLMLTFGGSFLLFCCSCFWRWCSFGENGPNGILTKGVVVVARFKLVLLEVLLNVGLKSDKLVLVSVEEVAVVSLLVVCVVVVVVVVVLLVVVVVVVNS